MTRISQAQLQLAVVRRKCKTTFSQEIFKRSHKSIFFLSSPGFKMLVIQIFFKKHYGTQTKPAMN